MESYSLCKGGNAHGRMDGLIIVCWKLPKNIKHIINEQKFLLRSQALITSFAPWMIGKQLNHKLRMGQYPFGSCSAHRSSGARPSSDCLQGSCLLRVALSYWISVITPSHLR